MHRIYHINPFYTKSKMLSILLNSINKQSVLHALMTNENPYEPSTQSMFINLLHDPELKDQPKVLYPM